MLISSMAIFGTVGIFRRNIPLASGIIAFARGIIGTVFLALFVKLRGRRLFHKIGARKIIRLAVTGAFIGINWILLFEAYNYTTVSTATLCYYMEPTLVILGSAILFGEKLTAKKGVCSVVALAGMVLVSGVVENGILQAGELKGILFGLGAAVFYAAVVLMNKKTVGVDAYEKTIIQLASAAVTLLPYLLLTENFSQILLDGKTIGLLIVVGILHTGITYVLYFGSMDGLRAQTVALFSYIDPITALLLSAVILGERMSIFGIIGSVLILGSAIFSEVEK